jgi:hypothetical protein
MKDRSAAKVKAGILMYFPLLEDVLPLTDSNKNKK